MLDVTDGTVATVSRTTLQVGMRSQRTLAKAKVEGRAVRQVLTFSKLHREDLANRRYDEASASRTIINSLLPAVTCFTQSPSLAPPQRRLQLAKRWDADLPAAQPRRLFGRARRGGGFSMETSPSPALAGIAR